MSKKKVVVKKKGFSIVSLLIGLLLGIIIVLGLLGGAIAYLVFGDIDSILSLFGLENQDEDGNYVYVNTDTENGGVSNVMDLISWYTGLGDYMDLSVAAVCEKLPIVETYVDVVYDMVADYGLDLDRTEVNSLKFSEFTDYIGDKLLDIQLGALLDNLGVSEGGEFGSNVIVQAMIYGVSAKYVYIYDDTGALEHRYPVWYDEYEVFDPNAAEELEEPEEDENTENEDQDQDDYDITTTSTAAEDLGSQETSGKYLRNKVDGSLLDETYWDYAALNADGYYRIYFYGYPETDTDEDGNTIATTYYVTEKDSSGSFVEKPGTCEERLEYTTYTATLHGNYYFDEDGNDVEANPITIRKLMENPYENLYEIYITDLYESNTDELGFLADVLGDVSLAELINGEVDFEEIVDNLELSAFMDVTIDPTSVNSAESILLYLLYGVTGVDADAAAGTNYDYVGTYHFVDGTSQTCYIDVDGDGNIIGVYIIDDDGNYVAAPGTTVAQVDARMNGLMDDLTIGEIVDVEGLNNPIIGMISGSTINGFASDINHMTMNQLFCNDIYGETEYDENGNATGNLVATQYEVVDPSTDSENIGEGQIAFDSDFTYYISVNGSAILTPIGDGYDAENGTYGNGHFDSWDDLQTFMSNNPGVTVYTFGTPRPLWKLLIYQTVTETDDDGNTSLKKDEDGSVIMYEVAYQVSDMNSMYYHIQYNVQNANLATLQEALMLDISDDFLNSHLFEYKDGSLQPSDKQVKDMTLLELLDYIQGNFTYTGVTVDQTEVTLTVGGSDETVSVTVSSSDSTTTWYAYSSNTGVATVSSTYPSGSTSSGTLTITAVGEGSTTITVYATDGSTVTINVTVNAA